MDAVSKAVNPAAGISFISQTRVARLAALHRPEIGPMIEYLTAWEYLAPLVSPIGKDSSRP